MEVKERLARHIISKPNGGECNEGEVNGREHIPALPPAEQCPAQQQVHRYQGQVHSYGHSHLEVKGTTHLTQQVIILRTL